MDPVSLKQSYPGTPFGIPEPTNPYPRLFLDNLRGVDIPEEGEIRFRYSRLVKTEREDRTGESVSVELCLKKITDICDCKGRDEENNEPETEARAKDTEETLDDLMESMDDEDMEEAEDEGY